MENGIRSELVELLSKIDLLKTEIDKLHPLPKETEERIFQKFRLDWNYNSNAIEGNSLNYGETFAFLMHGVTAGGKPLKDYLDIRGHNKAIDFLIDLVRNEEELTEAIIRELHKTILVEAYETKAITPNGHHTTKTVSLGAYKTAPNHVKTATGEIHYFASPEETPSKMFELLEWYRKSRNDKEIHPLVLASVFHHKFSEIHPFDDGNGRIARLLMNLLLMQNNLPPVIIKTSDRNNYYLALSQADVGDIKPFIKYIGDSLVHSLGIYLKGARGEDIDESDDIDKEILLLKKELEGNENAFQKYNSPAVRLETLKQSVIPLLDSLNEVIIKTSDLFALLNISYNFFIADDYSYPGRTRLNTFDSITLERDFDSLSQKKINSLSFTFHLEKFKTKDYPFSLELNVYTYFDEYNFIITCEIHGHKNNIKYLTPTNDRYSGHWLMKIPYDSQLTNHNLKEAKRILSKEIISVIKERKSYKANPEQVTDNDESE